MKMKTKSLILTFAAAAVTAAAGTGIASATAKKQTNRQVIDRFFEIVDSKQVDRLGEVDAPDLAMVTPVAALKGPQGHAQMVKGFATAFPNFKHETSRCLESGDLISCEGKFSGDHTGPMTMPDGKVIPPTQKHIEFSWAGIAQIKSGKVAELHVYFDLMTMMQQLGLVPQPTKTASR